MREDHRSQVIWQWHDPNVPALTDDSQRVAAQVILDVLDRCAGDLPATEAAARDPPR